MAEPGVATPRTWKGWTRGEGIVIVAGMLLAIDLLVLPWHHYFVDVDTGSLGIELPTFSYDRTGVQTPNPGFGIAALVLALGMVVQVVAARYVRSVPKMGQIHLLAGPAVFGLLLAKLIIDDEFLGTGAWLGLLLGAAMGLGGYLLSQDAPAPAGAAVSPP